MNNTVKFNLAQSLTDAQKLQARTNIGAASTTDIPAGVVKYGEAQSLTDAQKTQARTNIGAASTTDIPTGVELTANKVTSWSTTTSNTHYPSEKLVKDSIDSLDGSVVHTSGNETVAGTKTFTSSLIISQASSPMLMVKDTTNNMTIKLAADSDGRMRLLQKDETASSETAIIKYENNAYQFLGNASTATSATNATNATNATTATNYTSTGGIATALAACEKIANRVTSWSATTTHTKYPSEKLVKDSLDTIDTALAAKATDSAVVHIAGTETVTGSKTFSNNVTVSKSSWPMLIATDTTNNTSGRLAMDSDGKTRLYERDLSTETDTQIIKYDTTDSEYQFKGNADTATSATNADKVDGYHIVVGTIPSTPDANTIYLV